ncbi:DUF6633 family protein, partial [Pedobacter sp.]|uniref:DUF6633 family protein n=1 Tax=Pedobacter sp. TaxID=1411316 RepID=UPI003D7F6698
MNCGMIEISLLTASAVYCEEQHLKSEIDCFHSQSKTFGYLEANYPKAGLALMVVLVGELANSFNIGKNMSAFQVTDTAMMILREYPELKVDDVALCFTKAKQNAYGEVYDRLDSSIIFKWLERFLADKHEQVEYYWKHQQLALKVENATPLLEAPKAADNDTALKYLKKIRKDVVEIQKRNYRVKKMTLAKPVAENIIYQVHQVFIQNFKELYEAEIWEDPSKSTGTRFVNCCGKRLDIGEYIQKKHMQLINYYRKVNYYFGIEDPAYPVYIPPPMPDFSNQNEPKKNE